MDSDIRDAILLLRRNGYAVIKISKDMTEDMQKCEAVSKSGGDMDCDICSCCICITNH